MSGKKTHILVQLPKEQPDRCADCPLLGIIPENRRSPLKEDRFKSLICLGMFAALTKKFSLVRASKKDSHHPHRRPCDEKWETWQLYPNGKYPLSIEDDNIYREPYIHQQQRKINFNWK